MNEYDQIYQAMGLRIPLEGVEQQPCQVMACTAICTHTAFVANNAGFEVRLYLCDEHFAEISRPAPVGVNVFFRDKRIDSISLEDRSKAREKIMREIENYCLENGFLIKGDYQWSHAWVTYKTPQGEVSGTQYTGSVAVERVEVDARPKENDDEILQSLERMWNGGEKA